MNKSKENMEINLPKYQLNLYGYEYYFNSFVKLFNQKKLHNTILLSGPKGSGKATFAYHFVNYLLSLNDKNKYSINNYSIDPENKTYISICNQTNPNFLILENNAFDENIKIDNVREILKFLNKTTYNSNIKIILIDNIEYLNVNSSNALIKALEEPNSNTFFFIIHNGAKKILNTIKSRSIEFKLFFNLSQKKNILEKLLEQYKENLNPEEIIDYFYFDTPGNILKYISTLKGSDLDFTSNTLTCITDLILKYKLKKDPQLLSFISTFVEKFYNNLVIDNQKNLNIYFHNKFKILKQIDDVKKFNLDKNNFFISMQAILENESK